jgi:flagellar FliL protein
MPQDKSMRPIITGLILLLFISPSFAAGGSGGTPYFSIDTPFVVNLADNNSLAFLQVNAQLKVSNDEVKQQLYVHMPAIQHTMMLVLSEQTADDVKSVAGKQRLREKTLKEVQDLLKKQIGVAAVEEIYFTGFIVQ